MHLTASECGQTQTVSGLTIRIPDVLMTVMQDYTYRVMLNNCVSAS